MRVERVGHTAITWPFTPEGAMQAVADLSEIGYRGIELFGFVIDEYPGGVEALRAELQRAELKLAASYCSVSLVDPAKRVSDLDSVRRWAGQVSRLGGEVVVVGPNPREQPDYRDEDYATACAVLNDIGRLCADLGVAACFHPHTGTPVETRDEIARVMDNIDPRVVFMAPDTGQIAKGGGDAVEVVRAYRDLIRHIHLKDYVGGAPSYRGNGELVDRTGYLDYVPLGEGVVDLTAIVDTLEPTYNGWWMVELDGTPEAHQSPRQAAATSMRFLRTIIDGARRDASTRSSAPNASTRA